MVNNIFNRRQHLILLAILAIFTAGSILLALNFLLKNYRTTYLTVFFITLSFLLGIIYIINISFKFPNMKPYYLELDDVKISEVPVLEHFLDLQDSIYAKLADFEPHYIKTGIYLEQAALRESHMVMVSGYIWQEYDLTDDRGIRRGILLPEADPNPEYLSIEEAYRDTIDNKEIIGYYFRAALRKKFNYGYFPFDWQNIRIKIIHPDFVKNVICVPDLKAYPILNPTTLPGIKSKFEFPNWSIKQSFFSFKNATYHADFGMRLTSSRKKLPEMCFNVYIQRIYISPLVSNMFTIAIIIVLLFVAQVLESTSGNHPKKGILMGGLGLIELSAAFTFVLIIAHTSLRENLSVDELIYIDFYYFTTYFVILLTCVNYVFVKRRLERASPDSVLQTDWLKVHYWPIVFGIFFIVTVGVFY